jgi:hypothetical protein
MTRNRATLMGGPSYIAGGRGRAAEPYEFP